MVCSGVDVSLSLQTSVGKISWEETAPNSTGLVSSATRVRYPDPFAVGRGHGTSSGQQAGLEVARVTPGLAGLSPPLPPPPQ